MSRRLQERDSASESPATCKQCSPSTRSDHCLRLNRCRPASHRSGRRRVGRPRHHVLDSATGRVLSFAAIGKSIGATDETSRDDRGSATNRLPSLHIMALQRTLQSLCSSVDLAKLVA